uniref:CUB domain-containing protein n=1 Tax=Branchiostoma floridae TaxID=7739 RepID=C3ZJS2_BRAFL|eukprot:XP_002591196.1 hypothetical protein BRAFLDRAFT_105398 [Branchiostoma floridae]
MLRLVPPYVILIVLCDVCVRGDRDSLDFSLIKPTPSNMDMGYSCVYENASPTITRMVNTMTVALNGTTLSVEATNTVTSHASQCTQSIKTTPLVNRKNVSSFSPEIRDIHVFLKRTAVCDTHVDYNSEHSVQKRTLRFNIPVRDALMGTWSCTAFICDLTDINQCTFFYQTLDTSSYKSGLSGHKLILSVRRHPFLRDAANGDTSDKAPTYHNIGIESVPFLCQANGFDKTTHLLGVNRGRPIFDFIPKSPVSFHILIDEVHEYKVTGDLFGRNSNITTSIQDPELRCFNITSRPLTQLREETVYRRRTKCYEEVERWDGYELPRDNPIVDENTCYDFLLFGWDGSFDTDYERMPGSQKYLFVYMPRSIPSDWRSPDQPPSETQYSYHVPDIERIVIKLPERHFNPQSGNDCLRLTTRPQERKIPNLVGSSDVVSVHKYLCPTTDLIAEWFKGFAYLVTHYQDLHMRTIVGPLTSRAKHAKLTCPGAGHVVFISNPRCKYAGMRETPTGICGNLGWSGYTVKREAYRKPITIEQIGHPFRSGLEWPSDLECMYRFYICGFNPRSVSAQVKELILVNPKNTYTTQSTRPTPLYIMPDECLYSEVQYGSLTHVGPSCMSTFSRCGSFSLVGVQDKILRTLKAAGAEWGTAVRAIPFHRIHQLEDNKCPCTQVPDTCQPIQTYWQRNDESLSEYNVRMRSVIAHTSIPFEVFNTLAVTSKQAKMWCEAGGYMSKPRTMDDISVEFVCRRLRSSNESEARNVMKLNSKMLSAPVMRFGRHESGAREYVHIVCSGIPAACMEASETNAIIRLSRNTSVITLYKYTLGKKFIDWVKFTNNGVIYTVKGRIESTTGNNGDNKYLEDPDISWGPDGDGKISFGFLIKESYLQTYHTIECTYGPKSLLKSKTYEVDRGLGQIKDMCVPSDITISLRKNGNVFQCDVILDRYSRCQISYITLRGQRKDRLGFTFQHFCDDMGDIIAPIEDPDIGGNDDFIAHTRFRSPASHKWCRNETSHSEDIQYIAVAHVNPIVLTENTHISCGYKTRTDDGADGESAERSLTIPASDVLNDCIVPSLPVVPTAELMVEIPPGMADNDPGVYTELACRHALIVGSRVCNNHRGMPKSIVLWAEIRGMFLYPQLIPVATARPDGCHNHLDSVYCDNTMLPSYMMMRVRVTPNTFLKTYAKTIGLQIRFRCGTEGPTTHHVEDPNLTNIIKTGVWYSTPTPKSTTSLDNNGISDTRDQASVISSSVIGCSLIAFTVTTISIYELA